MIEFTLNDDPIDFYINAETEEDLPDNIRLLEDGDFRITEDGDYRILE